MNRHCSEECRQIASRHMKKCSASLFISEIQINTIMRHNLIPVIMIYIKNSRNNLSLQSNGEKWTLIHYCWKFCLLQPLWNAVWKVLKLWIERPYVPEIAGLGIYHLDLKTFQNDIYLLLFITVIGKLWTQTGCVPTDEMDHEDVIYIPYICNTMQLHG